jgi:hypothetical protein
VQVPFFAVAPLSGSALTVCHDGCVRSLNLSQCITGKGSQTDYVDGAEEDTGPEVVEYEARVGVGVQITASAVFPADNNLAIALSNMTVKFIEIPTATAASAQQQLGQDLTEVSAIDFVPPGSSHERYAVAFTCRHPQPNNVSCAPLSHTTLQFSTCDAVCRCLSSAPWGCPSQATQDAAAAIACTRRA